MTALEDWAQRLKSAGEVTVVGATSVRIVLSNRDEAVLGSPPDGASLHIDCSEVDSRQLVIRQGLHLRELTVSQLHQVGGIFIPAGELSAKRLVLTGRDAQGQLPLRLDGNEVEVLDFFTSAFARSDFQQPRRCEPWRLRSASARWTVWRSKGGCDSTT